MNYPEKNIKLRNGLEVTLRSPIKEDALEILDYLEATTLESPFTGSNPGERQLSLEDEEDFITAVLDSPHMLLLLALKDERVIASSHIRFYTSQKTCHRASVAIAIRKEYWNLGLGSNMLKVLLSLAKARETRLVELEYVQGNERARRLYDKLGFVEIGRKPGAFRLEQDYVDEILMVKEM